MADRSNTAVNACAGCKKYKRKCNKALPSCSTCSRLRRECSYPIPDPTRPTPEEEITQLRARVENLEELVSRKIPANETHSTSPASPFHESNATTVRRELFSDLLFLDQRSFAHLHCKVQPVRLPVPDDFLKALDDEYSQPRGFEHLMYRYFDAVHGWMPIISKARVKRVLDSAASEMQAEIAFLFSCMKLLLWRPQTGSPPEDLPLYRIVKEINVQLEMAGLQSLPVIQGGILTAVYELGHGIYPACYMTVAQCARQAISLGVHNREAPHFLQPWADWEEEIRTWWFIVMLDRHVTVGRELRPLCTEDPKKHTPLPADTEAWDDGSMIFPERLYMSSPTTAVTSPYARLAQAYNLMGRVIRHCDDEDQHLTFILEEMGTLHHAISALLDLVAHEKPEDSYVVKAVCFSSLMKLHKNFLYNSFHQRFSDKADPQLASRIRSYNETSLNTMRDTSLETLNLAQSLGRYISVSGIEKLSPLVLHCLYRAAFWLSYLARSKQEDVFVIGRQVLDRVLKTLSVRWKVASTYLEILETVYREGGGNY
ncbi:fungal specific transcription factor domain protein [Paecilomyces variotii No. 5]|uniref:Fungal specific transcription factor domain protein n=1 Tax=Byssochlamys spectabilis (strain No. 5 / NBRC 109023) TaxID=1356009 RepID=V5G3C3_BYSSN|nr:fungal specific transcription factor domain protein [Paecilomyces variotii No. 5]